MYGHIKQMAEAEKRGVEAAGGSVDLYQYVCGHTCQLGSQLTAFLRLPETLPGDVLEKMHAPPKDPNVQTLHDPKTLLEYDAFLFGIPTRYGNFPGQWKVRKATAYSAKSAA
jgi:NAD(P)H dehydrogenase (quinone)